MDQVTISRENLRQVLDELDGQQASQAGWDAYHKLRKALKQPVNNKDPQMCWNVRCQPGKKCVNHTVQEPVAWMVRNGTVNYQLTTTKEQAQQLATEMQRRHDLSGSLASFNVCPLYTAV